MNENNGSELVNLPQRGVARQELAAMEMDTTRDATATALATQARAEVESRIMAAKRWPRDIDNVRVGLLGACRRSRFADSAWYEKPIGGGTIGGLSVRFAEEAARNMGNLYSGSVVLYDDDKTRVIRVFLADLETNTSRDEIVTVQKNIERKTLKRGQQAIRTRTNSYGDQVYIVEATDDDVLQKQGALVSKAWRNLVLKAIPADILDECRDEIALTRKSEDDRDPTAARKKLADAFAAIGVKPDALASLLGHPLDACSPAEITKLRGYYAAIKSGETTWRDIMAASEETDAPAKPSKADEIAAALKATKPATGGQS